MSGGIKWSLLSVQSSQCRVCSPQVGHSSNTNWTQCRGKEWSMERNTLVCTLSTQKLVNHPDHLNMAMNMHILWPGGKYDSSNQRTEYSSLFCSSLLLHLFVILCTKGSAAVIVGAVSKDVCFAAFASRVFLVLPHKCSLSTVFLHCISQLYFTIIFFNCISQLYFRCVAFAIRTCAPSQFLPATIQIVPLYVFLLYVYIHKISQNVAQAYKSHNFSLHYRSLDQLMLVMSSSKKKLLFCMALCLFCCALSMNDKYTCTVWYTLKCVSDSASV